MTRYSQGYKRANEKLLIVADDFTGANDTGVQFSKRNLKTMVITNIALIRKSLKNCDVLVVNTESRFDDMETAYLKTSEIGTIVKDENIKYFYKKIDSTMRGNIGSELSGLMDSLDIHHAFVVPALPSYGRTTQNGSVFVRGVVLENTETANDPKSPVRESYIPSIISRQTNKSTAVVTHEDISAGKQILFEKLQKLINDGVRIIVIDANTNEDLDLIASVITEIKDSVLFAGCSGLAEFLSIYMEFKKEKKSNIVIAGSVSEITRKQIAFAVNKLNVNVVDIDIEKLFTSEREQEKTRISEVVGDVCASGEDLVIRSSSSAEAVLKSFETGLSYNMDKFRVSELIASFLGEIAGDIISQADIKGILLTGGDTAVKAAQKLNISGIVIQDEITHGIPYGYFADKQYKDIIIVSKAGGFGNEDAIFQVLNFLKNA